ncbi:MULTISPECIES: transcriptional regulator [Pseudomonas aeruginosa group]|uniref:Helix-turn-helix domain-containing protein n=1 Tax=Pseudomonas nitroreducens TaxID=46680 RepID=A0A6G6IPR3_PSENT|nr:MULTISPECIES: YdaS family helix-turn-helix protein [Pseudomonas aeruginosa group]QIE84953.1 helix-turn-helix domain-containing protein [Pseudomonas nitroreducens]
MTLLEFIKRLDRKTELDGLATRCGTSVGQLKQVAYGHRRASAALAIDLDRETSGAVPCEETRPDIDWAYLRGRKSAA